MQPPGSTPRSSSFVGRTPFFYGWVILAVSALSMFISGPGQTYSVSIFVDHIIADTGWSRTAVSALYTAGSLTAGLTMVFVGRLLDKLGSRVLMPAACVLFGLAALWMSRVNQPAELYAGFAFIRILGQGALFLIPSTLISLWFVRNRGKAVAIGSLGGALSAATFPILINSLINEFDWRTAWVALALIIWVTLLIPSILFVRRSPESVGMLPDGRVELKEDTGLQPDSIAEFNMSLGEALRTRTFWFLLLAGSSQPLIGTALVFHQISLLTGKGIAPEIAASVFAVTAPLQMAGTFLSGFLSDRFSNRHLLAFGQILLAAAMLFTFLISSTWHAFIYGALAGLGAGFIMTTQTVIWPNYYGRRHLGSIRGVVAASMASFAAIGPLPFGWIFDATGSYSTAILIFLFLPVLCGILALLAPPPHKGKGLSMTS